MLGGLSLSSSIFAETTYNAMRRLHCSRKLFIYNSHVVWNALFKYVEEVICPWLLIGYILSRFAVKKAAVYHLSSVDFSTDALNLSTGMGSWRYVFSESSSSRVLTAPVFALLPVRVEYTGLYTLTIATYSATKREV